MASNLLANVVPFAWLVIRVAAGPVPHRARPASTEVGLPVTAEVPGREGHLVDPDSAGEAGCDPVRSSKKGHG